MMMSYYEIKYTKYNYINKKIYLFFFVRLDGVFFFFCITIIDDSASQLHLAHKIK